MSKTFVSLTGGLGNQLFQLSAAINIAGDDEIVLLSRYGQPRSQIPGIPDLMGFSLSERISLEPNGRNTYIQDVARKGINFTLSAGVGLSAFRSNPLVRKSAEVVTSFAASIDLTKRVRVRGSSGVGFDSRLNEPQSNSLLVGYMQSWRYLEIDNFMQALGFALPRFGNDWFLEMQATAQQENPLVVHVRLGDYRNTEGFGFPSKAYFERAVAEIQKSESGQRIWIFSDEPDAALDFLPSSIVNSSPRVILPPLEASHPATTLAVMSLGKAFALTNSTFGYWAATLARVDGSRVSIPDPWFANNEAINEMADPSWLRLRR